MRLSDQGIRKHGMSVPPVSATYRPYSTDVTHYVISLFSGYYLIIFRYMSGKRVVRFYSDLRNQGSSAPSSYQAG